LTYNNQEAALLILGAGYTPFVIQGEVWRLVTAEFLHGNIIHLAFNMYALFILGNYIERFYGAKKLLTVYIITAIGASIVSIIGDFSAVWSGGVYTGASISVGASGAVFGMIGLLIGNRFKNSTYEPKLDINTNQLLMIVFYNLLIGLGLNFTGGSVFIDNWAHFGGLISGLLLGIFFDTVNNFYQSKLKKVVEKGIIILAWLIAFAAIVAQTIYLFSNLFIK
jgi:rhomboid protease GluP